MFNSNPSAFYMFEPLDALYSALYGTSPGWNVPSDITSFANGSTRLVSTSWSKRPPPHVAVDAGYAQALARWAGRSGVQIAGVENAGVENARV